MSYNLQFPPLKYGYSSARVRAMRGLLLKSSALSDLIKVNTVEGMAELLQRTDYKNDLAAASVGYSGSAMIELAAAQNFARTVQKLFRLTPKSDVPVISVLLLKWDLLNLKALIHGRKLNISYETLRPYLFLVGGFSEFDFKSILKADERDLQREIRKTAFGKRVLDAARSDKSMYRVVSEAFGNVNKFIENESVMDSSVYLLMDSLLAKVRGNEIKSIRESLKTEIDLKNVMIIERLKLRSVDRPEIKKSLIKGGSLSDAFFERLIDAKDLSSVLNLLKAKLPALDVNLTNFSDHLVSLEIAFERAIAKSRLSTFHREILSIGVVVGFLLLKEEEMHNLRKIAKAKEFGFSESSVREMLVSV